MLSRVLKNMENKKCVTGQDLDSILTETISSSRFFQNFYCVNIV